jgi:hypothetical protein
MELEIIISEVTQTQKDRYLLFSLICGDKIKKKKDVKAEGGVLGEEDQWEVE